MVCPAVNWSPTTWPSRRLFRGIRRVCALVDDALVNEGIFRLAVVVALTTLTLPAIATVPSPPIVSFVNQHCVSCHDAETKKGDLDLERLNEADFQAHSDTWERVVRRLQTRQMPPASRKARPTEAEYAMALKGLTKVLDADARVHPRPGRTETIRRLTRAEYQNVVRDLLAVDLDAAALLPADDASHGFDNVTVGTLSPTLLERYITAAQKVSRLAVGAVPRVPDGETIRIRPDITQEERIDGLPFGTRGGSVIPHGFPQDGDYEIALRLARDRNDEVEGLREAHELVVLIDRAPVQSFTVRPPRAGEGHHGVDAHLKFRLPVKAGSHVVGVTFVKQPSSLQETRRQPYQAHFNFHRHPRIGPALYQVSITGPFNPQGPGDTASRRQIFVARPKVGASAEEEARCVQQVLGNLLRRAWRRPVTEMDIARLRPFFDQARANAKDPVSGFEAGIETALSAILVSREFLFRVESEPRDLAPGSAYPVSDVELASRLSFFLWSSLPDAELLNLAERGRLRRPDVLARQARRMLTDPRAESLVRNFGGQWLHLRNLDSFTPDGRLFPDFDDNLRQSLRRETELLFGEVVRDDRSVLDLLRTDHAWLNERLARHYGIPHVHGPQFRRVELGPGVAPEGQRGGLLRNGSVLTVTSYATRTSPVLRGKWILENLIGTPPPPPAPNVPALDDSAVAASLPVRERLAAHRNKPACVGCHEFIDPPGFALENYDALGWRTREEGKPVDATGGLPDGRILVGVGELEKGMIERPDIFVTALTEKLLTFALGRGMEPADGPAVRAIVRQSAADQHRFSAVIMGIVNSNPFRMRQVGAASEPVRKN